MFVLNSLMVLLAGALFWSWSLKKQVRDKTGALETEIAERKIAERLASHKSAGMAAINRLLMESFDCQNEENIATLCLRLAMELTGSTTGFIGEVDDVDCFSVLAVTYPGYESPESSGSTPSYLKPSLAISGAWERVIRGGDSILVNDMASLEHPITKPVGCPDITSLITVPLKFRGSTIGMITLANKDSGYDATDRKAVEALARPFMSLFNRRRIEENLRDSHEKYRELLETITDGFAVFDQSGTFIYASRRLGSLLGYDHELMLGESVEKFLSKRNFDKVMNFFKSSAKEEHQSIELTWQTKDDHNIDTLMASQPMLDEYGWLIGRFAAITDVTELKRAKRKLVDVLVQLDRYNQELQQFAYVASHDLQEPLRKITFFGYHLKKTYSDRLDKEGCDYLDRMENATTRMKKLISSLLEYNRVTTKAQPFELVDLKSVVEEVLSDLELRIEETNAEITVGDLPTVSADQTQMRQIFQNLIQNALKFRNQNEPPIVNIHSQRHDDGTVEIVVRDDGIGFDEKYLDRMLQPFQRLHTRDEFTGVGMGLAICDKIITRHGGSFTAQSKPGKGAAFIIRLKAW